MKERLLQFACVLVMSLFACPTMLAQEGAGIKVEAESAEVSLPAYSNKTPDKIIDGSYTSCYESIDAQEAGTTVTVTLGEEVLLDFVKIYLKNNLYRHCPLKIKLQVSTDNQKWIDVEGSEINPQRTAEYDSSSQLNTFSINAKGYSAKYIRMVILEPGIDYLVIYEIEVYEKLKTRLVSVSVNDLSMGSAYIGLEGVTEIADVTGPVTIVAVPNETSKFINWTVAGNEVSTNSSYTDESEEDKEFVANFREKYTYNVSVSSSNNEYGEATASQIGEVLEDTEITFTATAIGENTFENWTIDGEIVSLENPYIATITADMDVVANFSVSTGIEWAEATKQTLKAVVEAGEIKVYGTSEGKIVTVYTASGAVIVNTVSQDVVTTIKTDATGIILIKVGSTIIKVVK